MTAEHVLLVGAGGHARSCIDVIEQSASHRVAGLLGTESEVGRSVMGYNVLGTESDIPKLRETYQQALVTVGQILSPCVRNRLFDALQEAGYSLPVIMSPLAWVSPHAQVGAGTIVMHGAIVNAGARIGTNCIINSRALIEHDSTIGDHTHISTGAIVNGGVTVGRKCFVGSGCAIKEGVTLGDSGIVGMGLSIRHDHPDDFKIVRSD